MKCTNCGTDFVGAAKWVGVLPMCDAICKEVYLEASFTSNQAHGTMIPDTENVRCHCEDYPCCGH
jgi:hypothetical protein